MFVWVFLFFSFFFDKVLPVQKKTVSLRRNRNECDAQMAESVDALVSNTSGFTSIPVRPRVWVQAKELSI